MKDSLTQLQNLKSPEITIDEAIVICKRLLSKQPELHKVITRIKQLRKERDFLHRTASQAMSDAAWERSGMKKWADKQSREPDND